eukprot:TRINITY_DN2043_c0_g1_i9.p1 TRINITY_DN2043_c0_g1~~TRINITY_DN2043_c0_g1_i9.p1  ORF type:complete len:466 (+),score=98.12 TRINITY_DN2043_c0_g1_i9:146-1543(+)
MQKGSVANCKVHYGQKLRKFCMKPECWAKVCPKCATDKHKGHKVVDRLVLSQEAKAANNKLFQVKKSEILSISKFLETIESMQTQLREIHEKRKCEAKAFELDMLAKISKVVQEEALKVTELEGQILALYNQLKETHKSQTQETSKIPELANAVIAKGTIDDLKTFFEMCQKGMEGSGELGEYRKRMEQVKENIEDYTILNPVNFLIGSGLLHDGKIVSSPHSLLLSLPQSKHTEEIMNDSLNSVEQFTPLQKINNSFMSTKRSEKKKLIHKSKSSLGAYPKKSSATDPRLADTRRSTAANKNSLAGTSRVALQRNADKAATETAGGRCVSALKSRRASHGKNLSLVSANRVASSKGAKSKSIWSYKLIKMQSVIGKVKSELNDLAKNISANAKDFTSKLSSIKNNFNEGNVYTSTFELIKTKEKERLTECVRKQRLEYEDALRKRHLKNRFTFRKDRDTLSESK